MECLTKLYLLLRCPVDAVCQAPPPLQLVPLTAGSIGTPVLAHGEPLMLCQQILGFLTVCMEANLGELEGNQLAATSLLLRL